MTKLEFRVRDHNLREMNCFAYVEPFGKIIDVIVIDHDNHITILPGEFFNELKKELSRFAVNEIQELSNIPEGATLPKDLFKPKQ